ncbi:uncharacterized protein C12orf76 homolog [Sphaerodactylus townsendi]|uniref:uncharacterized protein C12orf76 homolog n=1 Tax=Sphaerodactylus townsendi TaxID=933632 RepID=UPI00202629B5|nr:uncharacterized protein C12orf76 homolog [Sphaerodactylus townsendi]
MTSPLPVTSPQSQGPRGAGLGGALLAQAGLGSPAFFHLFQMQGKLCPPPPPPPPGCSHDALRRCPLLGRSFRRRIPGGCLCRTASPRMHRSGEDRQGSLKPPSPREGGGGLLGSLAAEPAAGRGHARLPTPEAPPRRPSRCPLREERRTLHMLGGGGGGAEGRCWARLRLRLARERMLLLLLLLPGLALAQGAGGGEEDDERGRPYAVLRAQNLALMGSVFGILLIVMILMAVCVYKPLRRR